VDSEARAAAPDFLFSFYYRHMLGAEWLHVATRGALNMHGSLLPKYRGRASVHWAILNGESATGASLHYMLEKPDAGALVDQQPVPIAENDTALDVSVRVAEAAAAVLKRSLPQLIAGTADGMTARSLARLVFRAAAPRGRPHRLAQRRARGARPRTGCRAAVPRRLYRPQRV
jgi:methionyl-tRNA formyltransferase